MVVALAGPKDRALRGEEAVVGAGLDVHFAAGAWGSEDGSRESGENDGELHVDSGLIVGWVVWLLDEWSGCWLWICLWDWFQEV